MVVIMLLYTGRLAQQHVPCLAHSQLGPMPHHGMSSLSLKLRFFGTTHQTVEGQRLPHLPTHKIGMGHMLGQGSTGAVQVGLLA